MDSLLVTLSLLSHAFVRVRSRGDACNPRRLVSGSGDIKITKDGLVLLNEMVCAFFTLLRDDVLYDAAAAASRPVSCKYPAVRAMLRDACTCVSSSRCDFTRKLTTTTLYLATLACSKSNTRLRR